MGRPSKFTQDIADAICSRIAEGESLRAICTDAGLPSARTVHVWLDDKEGFLQQYVRAREAQADFYAEEILDIADYDERDWSELKDDSGRVTGIKVDGEAIQRSKLRVDTRKWLMSKLSPKKYGDKLELGGPDGSSIIPVINVTVGSTKSEPS